MMAQSTQNCHFLRYDVIWFNERYRYFSCPPFCGSSFSDNGKFMILFYVHGSQIHNTLHCPSQLLGYCNNYDCNCSFHGHFPLVLSDMSHVFLCATCCCSFPSWLWYVSFYCTLSTGMLQSRYYVCSVAVHSALEMYRYQNLNRYRYRYRYWILKQNRYRYWTNTDTWIFQF